MVLECVLVFNHCKLTHYCCLLPMSTLWNKGAPTRGRQNIYSTVKFQVMHVEE